MKCHLFGDANFYVFRKKPFLDPIPSDPPPTTTPTPDAYPQRILYIYTQQPRDFLGAPEIQKAYKLTFFVIVLSYFHFFNHNCPGLNPLLRYAAHGFQILIKESSPNCTILLQRLPQTIPNGYIRDTVTVLNAHINCAKLYFIVFIKLDYRL